MNCKKQTNYRWSIGETWGEWSFVYAKVCELMGISLVPLYLRYTEVFDTSAHENQAQ
jgi:hypothetical protein